MQNKEYSTDRDFVKYYAEMHDLNEQEAVHEIEGVFYALRNYMVKHDKVRIRRYGIFEMKPAVKRKRYNPSTNLVEEMPSRYKLNLQIVNSYKQNLKERLKT